MDPTDITTKNTCSTTTRTLVEVVLHLKDIEAAMVRYATPQELISYELPSEHTQLQIYRVIRVYLTHAHKAQNQEMYMIFVDNGAIYYTQGDVLEDYILDDPDYFSDIPYNYEAIFEDFFIGGGQDIASFAGFFFLK